MTNKTVLIRVVLLSVALLRAASGQTADSVLLVENTTLDADGTTAHLQLRNTSNKTITAYAMTGTASSEPSFTDFFPSVGLEWLKGAGGIPGGETKSTTIVRSGHDFPLVRVVAVVFADRSAIGDEKQIERIFRNRSDEASEMSGWCEMLGPGRLPKLDRGMAGSTLSDLMERIRRAPPASAPAAVTARRDLLSKLEQGGWRQEPAVFVTLLRSHCAAMAVHARREGVK
jgi:hypothetical protein